MKRIKQAKNLLKCLVSENRQLLQLQLVIFGLVYNLIQVYSSKVYSWKFVCIM